MSLEHTRRLASGSTEMRQNLPKKAKVTPCDK